MFKKICFFFVCFFLILLCYHYCFQNEELSQDDILFVSWLRIYALFTTTMGHKMIDFVLSLPYILL